MTFRDWYDRSIFGKKYCDLSTSEHKERVEEEREYENGAFHVKYIKKGGFCREEETTESTIEGKVVGFGDREGNTYLVLKTQKGTNQEVFFPKKFSQDKKDSLKNQKIKYFVFSEHTFIPNGSILDNNYRIDVLEGPLKGNFFERSEYDKDYKKEIKVHVNCHHYDDVRGGPSLIY